MREEQKNMEQKPYHSRMMLVNSLLLAALIVAVCSYAVLVGNTSHSDSHSVSPPEPAAHQSQHTPPTAALTATPLITPTATTTTRFPRGSRVAGVDIGGMERTAATTKLTEAMGKLYRPLTLTATERISTTLEPTAIDLEVPIDAMLATAAQQAQQGSTVYVPMQADFDATRLRQMLTRLAYQTVVTPTTQVLSSTEHISRSFALTPGSHLDIDRAMNVVAKRLRRPDAERSLHLPWTTPLTITGDMARPVVPLAQVAQHVQEMANTWDGVVGFFLLDLESGEAITHNAQTVFSGASVLKAAILLYAYASQPEFDDEQRALLREMIIESDNLAANGILATSVGNIATNTDAALEGTRAMTAMLQQLGFEHTYQNLPYEAYDYLVGQQGVSIPEGAADEGAPPYTQADTLVRTTPAEMGRLFHLIDQCSRGEGLLLEQFGATLSAQRCQEMLDLLAQNGDHSRIYSGLPAHIRVEHKSGWTENMNGDVGIVRSPGGDFVLAVYVYQDTDDIVQEQAAAMIGHIARLAYTAYNPVIVEAEQGSSHKAQAQR
jgi:beta-lactamase class A